MFKCKICGQTFSTEKDQLECESKPITYDNADIGDEVKILIGQCSGQYIKVEEKWVVTKDWGHYDWKRYWHTIAISGKVIDDWGSRQLTFDAYEPCKRIKRRNKLKRIINEKLCN